MASSRSSYYGSPYAPRSEKTAPVKPASPPSSPPRKVVTDFKAFGASPTASVFGTAVQSTPFSLAGGKAAFGGMRSNGRSAIIDDDDDDDDDDGRQKVELREDSITLDQACYSINSLRYATNITTHDPVGTTHCYAECLEKHQNVNGDVAPRAVVVLATGSWCSLPLTCMIPLVRSCILTSHHT